MKQRKKNKTRKTRKKPSHDPNLNTLLAECLVRRMLHKRHYTEKISCSKEQQKIGNISQTWFERAHCNGPMFLLSFFELMDCNCTVSICICVGERRGARGRRGTEADVWGRGGGGGGGLHKINHVYLWQSIEIIIPGISPQQHGSNHIKLPCKPVM